MPVVLQTVIDLWLWTGCCVEWKNCLFFTGMELSLCQILTSEYLIWLMYAMLIYFVSYINSVMFVHHQMVLCRVTMCRSLRLLHSLLCQSS